MVKVQIQVTGEGWTVNIETNPEASEAEITAAYTFAGKTVEARHKLEEAGPHAYGATLYDIAQTLGQAGTNHSEANGESEAEHIQD